MRLRDDAASVLSPYLRDHIDNPVDWWAFGPDAFAEARRRDVPILLSVGYAACHWCHVMAHESFEDPATAAFMNEHFVNIKVDREERPDVDAVYMRATQAMTGSGGWPMTVVITAEGEPFFAGTYFPDRPRHGQPAFTQVLRALAEAWRDRRDEIMRVAGEVLSRLDVAIASDGSALDGPALAQAVSRLERQFDPDFSGFGRAPKFPASMVLEFLLRHHARTGSESAERMVSATCDAMARGGLYDQVGGGFARYSVDAQWVVPHFEKMLYDNALLLGVYARWWRQSGVPLAERVAQETADFLLRELRTDQGGFASALDADSEGEEGRFYVFDPAELARALPEPDVSWAADLLSVTDAGTFEHGSSTLQMRRDPDDPRRWARVRAALFDYRAGRTRPAVDDKVVAAWNGLAIASLAEAGMLLGKPGYVDAARGAADLLLGLHLVDGRLLRVSRDGVPGDAAGVLEDYGCVAAGLLAVAQATGDAHYLRAAGGLLDQALAHFSDGEGGFFDTADDAEALVARPRDPSDNASPSGLSAVADALTTYAALTGSGPHREAAEAALRSVAGFAIEAPRFAGWSLAVAEAHLVGPIEVAVVSEEETPLSAIAWQSCSPGRVVVSGRPDDASWPLLAGRGLVEGRAAAYVCRSMVCERPVVAEDQLRAMI